MIVMKINDFSVIKLYGVSLFVSKLLNFKPFCFYSFVFQFFGLLPTLFESLFRPDVTKAKALQINTES